MNDPELSGIECLELPKQCKAEMVCQYSLDLDQRHFVVSGRLGHGDEYFSDNITTMPGAVQTTSPYDSATLTNLKWAA